MTTIETGNWSFKDPPFKDGDVVESCNCSQLYPNTEICNDVRNLTIHGGNFVNCKQQPTWTVTGGNWAQVSRCSHVNSWLVERGLPVCAENCKHRVGDTKQWVEIDEEEYRKENNSTSQKRPNVKIEKVEDADGVTIQKFQKEVFVYAETVVK